MLIDPREMLSCCLFQVKFTVLLEVCLVVEALPTLSTHKGFFSCVDSLFSVSVSALFEALPTLGTHIGLLAPVGSLVLREC